MFMISTSYCWQAASIMLKTLVSVSVDRQASSGLMNSTASWRLSAAGAWFACSHTGALAPWAAALLWLRIQSLLSVSEMVMGPLIAGLSPLLANKRGKSKALGLF